MRWTRLALITLSLAFLLPMIRRGLVLSDEGYMLQQALDLLHGRVLYRDLDAFVAPGDWFLLGLIFSIFEPSILASRIGILAADLAAVACAHRIVTSLAGPRYGVASVILFLVLSVWAFPAWTFTFYSPLAIVLCLLALDRLLEWQRRERSRDLLLVGLFLGLAICFKQNYGMFALFAGIGGYVLHRIFAAGAKDPGRSAWTAIARELGTAAGGVILGGLPFLAYLVYHGALPEAWQSLVVHPFEFSGKHDIPFASLEDLLRVDLYTTAEEKLTYMSMPMVQLRPIGFLLPLRIVHRMHVLLYWLPIALLLAGGVLALWPDRRRGRAIDVPLATTVLMAGLLFIGVLPRADFNHLMNVYQPMALLAPIVLQRVLVRVPTARTLPRRAALAVFALLGLAYGGVAVYWYGHLIEQFSWTIDSPRSGVLVGHKDAFSINAELALIEQKSEPGRAVLTLPDLSMLNFLADRPVPSRYYNLYEHHIAHDQGAGVVAGAERHGVDLVVTRYDDFFSDRVGLMDYAPKLADYLVTHFERTAAGKFDDWIVYERRPEPLPVSPWVDVLADCDTDEDGVVLSRHLLFAALYHKASLERPMPPRGRETICRLKVPESGGVLSLELGYRSPHHLTKGATIQGLISLRADGEPELLDRETFRIVRDQGLAIQTPFKRIEVDLTPWAGRDVELSMRSILQGYVKAHPVDYKGFALVWRDPRVVRETGGARP